MFAQIILKRIENEPPSSKVIPTCDIRLLLLEHSEVLALLERAVREVEWTKKQIDLKPRVKDCDTLSTFIQAAKAAITKATGGEK